MKREPKLFRCVAERNLGIRGANGRQVNPFHIRDIFDPNLTMQVEKRTWDCLKATSERALRKWFDEAVQQNIQGLRGFRLVEVTEIEGLTQCDMHEDESC